MNWYNHKRAPIFPNVALESKAKAYMEKTSFCNQDSHITAGDMNLFILPWVFNLLVPWSYLKMAIVRFSHEINKLIFKKLDHSVDNKECLLRSA